MHTRDIMTCDENGHVLVLRNSFNVLITNDLFANCSSLEQHYRRL